MVYLLLLALVYTFAIAILFLQSADRQRSAALASIGFGLLLLAVGYAAQLALGFELSEGAARFFYWARYMLAVAWLGHGFLLLVFPKSRIGWWANRAMIFASFVALGLIAFTQITNAEDWFRPARTVYSQISDLLATNRPTRWLGLLLNFYGGVALIGGAIYSLTSSRKVVSTINAGLIIAGAILLSYALFFSPVDPGPTFYLMELAAPLLIFVGLAALTDVNWSPSAKRRKATP